MKIVFYGDSICTGQKFPINRGWVPRISARLESEVNGNLIVSNLSINGRTTREALLTMPREIQSDPPDIIIVQFGMNDCNYWRSDNGIPRISKESFKANLKEIINRCFHFNISDIFVITNHPTSLTDTIPFVGISYQQSNEEYNHIILEVCEDERNLYLIDMEKKFKSNMFHHDHLPNHYLLSDFLHLNQHGHDLYYETVYPVIKEVVTNARD